MKSLINTTMNSGRLLFSILLIMLCVIPSINADQKDQMTPLIIEKIYNAGMEKARDSVSSTIDECHGKIRFFDKESPLFFFSIQDKNDQALIYVNIYLEQIEKDKIVIYFVAHGWDGRSLEPVEQQFFKSLDKRLAGGIGENK